VSLLIKNGEIVTADARMRADIYCENETITKIGTDLDAPAGAEVIDAGGKYVFPGFIDPHVHIHLPFMGTGTKDTHTTGSQAALVGGTTTFIEMMAPNRTEDLAAGYAHWKALAEGNSACDYTFHVGVTKYDDTTEAQLREIVADGMTSFKVFLSYKNFFGVTDEELYRALTLAKELGVIVTAHCENDEIVAQLQQKLLSEGKGGPEWHHESRPERVEAEGTHHFATFLELTGARGYVVHLSCEPALEAALAARRRGVPLGIEVVTPHLLLDKTYAERPNFEGAKYVMSPPLRDERNHKPLWDALAAGIIDTVATDHAPFDFVGQSRSTSWVRRSSAAATSPRSPTASRTSRTASTCSTPTASAAASSTCTASWRRHRRTPPRPSGCSLAKGLSRWAPTPTWWCTTRTTGAS